MKYMTLREITASCRGTYYGADSFVNLSVSGVAIDSRKIEKDYLFVPIRGARVDGHNYIPQVMEAGALCTLSEEPIENADFPYILVESCGQALKDIATHYRQCLDITVVGITGSVGKTSTKEMIASVLSQKFQVLKTAGNYNNEIGLPLTIFNLREDHDIAVLEMGISEFGEMSRLSQVARPDIAIITNIGECHLENLYDRDGVLKAKSEIFQFMNPDGTIILNGEDDKLATINGVNDIAPYFFGLSDDCYTYASDIQNLGLAGTSCTIHLTKDRSFSCVIPIPGSHMVLNALAGSAVGLELGLSNEEIQAGIESLVPVSGRNNIIRTDKFTIIDDCYNANPVSMRASLDVLASATTRRVAILGDMGELGENENQMHYDLGIYAGEKSCEVICCIGTLSQHMYKGLQKVLCTEGTTTAYYYPSKDAFLEQASSLLEAHDSILVKASNFMGFKDIVEYLIAQSITD